TGITMGLVDKAHKGGGLTLALWPWGWGLWCHRARSGITSPHPMEHAGQPHQSDQPQLVEQEIRDHGKTPSCKCRNEGILPGFQTTGISRRLEVHDPVMRHVEETHLAAGPMDLASDVIDVVRAVGETRAQVDDRDAGGRDRRLIDKHAVFSCEQ